jgi:NADPH:quinone reductase-like Zn-dependent oxidoreductase
VQKFKAYRTFEDNKVVTSRFVEMTRDELDPGEVVVRTKYSTINYKDALSYNGAGRIMRNYPCNAGIDMAGTVDSSTDAEAGRQGDRPRLRPSPHDGAASCPCASDWIFAGRSIAFDISAQGYAARRPADGA